MTKQRSFSVHDSDGYIAGIKNKDGEIVSYVQGAIDSMSVFVKNGKVVIK